MLVISDLVAAASFPLLTLLLKQLLMYPPKSLKLDRFDLLYSSKDYSD